METPSTRKIGLLIEYDGTDFFGWQRQPKLRTVQQTLEEALGDLTGETIRLIAAGRTDTGVHARGQVAAFETARQWPDEVFQNALRPRLPRDVGILAAWEAPADFNPRGDAIRRTYSYRLWNRRVGPIIDRNQWAHYSMPLDFDRIGEASRRLAGDHDFRGFRSAQCKAKRTRLTVERLEWRETAPGLWIMEIASRFFLHHMVRTIVGTLIEIGRGAKTPDLINRVLKTGDRALAGAPAGPEGLTLERVEYPEAMGKSREEKP